jgi:hypothetical protein
MTSFSGSGQGIGNVLAISRAHPNGKRLITIWQLPADEIELMLIAAERERINELYRQGALKDEARRRLERELDLREANLANHQHDE